MRIQTDIRAAVLTEAIAGGAEFAIYQGKLVGSEQAHMPDWHDNAWALKRGAEDMIEEAAAAIGDGTFDADPVQIEILIVSAEGQEFQAKGWFDRREIAK